MSALTEWQGLLGMYLNSGQQHAVEALLSKLDMFTVLEAHKKKLFDKYPEIYNKHFEYKDTIAVSDDELLCKKYLNKVKNARDRGIDFNLSLTSLKNIMRAKKCYFTGLTLTKENSTIDRVNSKIGYIKGNVVACHADINQLKSVFESQSHMDNKQLKQLLKKWGDKL
jgi:hypothetical protein